MNLCLIGHNFRYELEKLIRIFLPFEKIEFFDKEIISDSSALTVLYKEQGVEYSKATLYFLDKVFEKVMEIDIGAKDLKKEQELKLALCLYDCFTEACDYIPQWGILTGVRPAKLFSHLVKEQGRELTEKYFEDYLKVSKKKKRVALPLIFFALDFVYALLCGCAFILLEYYANDGTPRAFSFFGVLLGFVLYYFTLGRLVLAISERIAFVIRIMLAYLALPFERVFSLISAYLDKAKQKRLLRQKKKKAMDFDKKKRAELALCASDAFLEFEKE